MKALTAVNVGVFLVNLLLIAQTPASDDRRAAGAPARPSADLGPRELRAEHATDVRITETSAKSGDEPIAVPVRLAEDQLRGLVAEVYREDRLWRRTSGVLHGLDSLRRKGVLAELGESVRARVVKLTRAYAGQRVGLERALMAAEVTEMERLRGELIAFDGREVERIEQELRTFMEPAQAAQVARLIVPGNR